MSSRLQASKNTEERDQLILAMMGHEDAEQLKEWVARALGDALGASLPSQEWATMFSGLAANHHHKRLAWNLMTRHWQKVYETWGQSQFKMKSIVAAAMTKADIHEVRSFFTANPCSLAYRSDANFQVVARFQQAMASEAMLPSVVSSRVSKAWRQMPSSIPWLKSFNNSCTPSLGSSQSGSRR